MTNSITTKLIVKDYKLFSTFLYGYIALGCISAVLMAVPSFLVYYSGVVLLITVLIAASAHFAMSSVITEKREFQLSFIMALPIRPIDYTRSKLVGGILIYALCWMAIVGVTLIMIATTHLPNGMMPITLILSLEMFLAFVLLLSISLLSGSIAITIVSMVIMNIFFNLFMFAIAGIPEIGSNIQSQTAVFNDTALSIIGIELALIVIVASLTYLIKSRQKCFM